MTTIVHFDVPAEDIQRAKIFYETVFNWEITRVPGPMEYFNIATKDEKGKPVLCLAVINKTAMNKINSTKLRALIRTRQI